MASPPLSTRSAASDRNKPTYITLHPPQHTNPLDLSDADFLDRAERMCSTKVPYTTRTEAATLTRRHGFCGTPYRCPWCDHWHITTYDRARAKAFTRRLSRLLRSP
jgi:hypothetical protein